MWFFKFPAFKLMLLQICFSNQIMIALITSIRGFLLFYHKDHVILVKACIKSHDGWTKLHYSQEYTYIIQFPWYSIKWLFKCLDSTFMIWSHNLHVFADSWCLSTCFSKSSFLMKLWLHYLQKLISTWILF